VLGAGSFERGSIILAFLWSNKRSSQSSLIFAMGKV
jgi:hypothetical protein